VKGWNEYHELLPKTVKLPQIATVAFYCPELASFNNNPPASCGARSTKWLLASWVPSLAPRPKADGPAKHPFRPAPGPRRIWRPSQQGPLPEPNLVELAAPANVRPKRRLVWCVGLIGVV